MAQDSHNVPSQKHIVNARQYGITPNKIQSNALKIVEKLQAHGFEAYIVGGCLRDLLQGKTPKDFDVATNARPEQIQKVFQRQCRIVGRRFRLAHILFGREFIEVATFRASHDGNLGVNQSRRSESGMLLRDNVYGTLEDDARRRDFTINAFYYDPAKNQLIDFFQGLADLNAGKLRLIGEPEMRYKEDPVRMLRAIRFMAKLDLFLDAPTQAPIVELAPLLANIPSARLYDESLKLFQTGYGLKTYKLLRQFHLFEHLMPMLMPFFTERNDTATEKMIELSLNSTDERIADNLPINPAFLFAALLWYPLRERVEMLKNEGGLNNHDAFGVAINDVLATFCLRLNAPRRHTSVIRDIWLLQLKFAKRQPKNIVRTFEHPKFRAAFDLLMLRAQIEGQDTIEQASWWFEYQQSNGEQRENLVRQHSQRNQKQPSKARKRRAKPRKAKPAEPCENATVAPVKTDKPKKRRRRRHSKAHKKVQGEN